MRNNCSLLKPVTNFCEHDFNDQQEADSFKISANMPCSKKLETSWWNYDNNIYIII